MRYNQKVIRIICLGVGFLGIILTAKTIKNPFWNQPVFVEKIEQMQKEGNYLPYRLRKIVWSKEVAVIKVEVERIISTLWPDRWVSFLGLVLIYPLLAGINKKMWPEILIIFVITAIGVLENNPNPSYFMNFTLFPITTLVINGIKRIRKR